MALKLQFTVDLIRCLECWFCCVTYYLLIKIARVLLSIFVFIAILLEQTTH